jgi:hypothetical protein
MPTVVFEPAVENLIPGPSREPQPLATTIFKAPTISSSTSTLSPIEPASTQNPLVVAIECPDFVDARTLPDFEINDTNLSEPQTDLMEICIPSFTL